MSYVEFPALCCQDGRYSQYEGEYEINVQVLLVSLSKLRLSSHKREDTLTLLPQSHSLYKLYVYNKSKYYVRSECVRSEWVSSECVRSECVRSVCVRSECVRSE